MPIPTFNSEDDLSFYQEVYHEKLNHYVHLLDSTITRLLGETYSVESLSGETLRQIVGITDNLIYEANYDLRRKRQQLLKENIAGIVELN